MSKVAIVISSFEGSISGLPGKISWLTEGFPHATVFLESGKAVSNDQAISLPGNLFSNVSASHVAADTGSGFVVRIDPDCCEQLHRDVIHDMIEDMELLDKGPMSADLLVPDGAVMKTRNLQVVSGTFLKRVAGGERFKTKGFAAPVSQSGHEVGVYNYRPSLKIAGRIWSELEEKIDSKSYPSFWQVSPGEVCNLNCYMCPFHSKDSDQATKDFYNNFHKNHRGAILKAARYKEMLDEVTEVLPISKVVLTGFGEPLINKEFYEMVKYTSGKGLNCGITTNGTLLNEDRLKRLIDSGVTDVNVSIDAAGAGTYKKIRKGAPAYDIVEKQVENLCRLGKKNGIGVGVGFVVQDINRDEADTFINKWKDIADAVRCSQENYLLGYKGQWLNGDFAKRKACFIPVEGVYTLADGNTAACPCLLPVESWSFENGGFKKLWEETLLPFAKSNYEGPLPKSCAGCDIWANEISITVSGGKWDRVMTPTSYGVVRNKSLFTRAVNKIKRMIK